MVTGAQAKDYNFRVGHLLPESMLCGAAANDFARIVEEKSNGQIKMTIYFGGQLGPWQEQFDMVSQGSLDMGFLAVSPRYKSLYPLSAPWIVTGWDQYRKLWSIGDGILYQYADKAFDKLNIKFLAPFCIGFEGIGGMKGPIVLPEDIKKMDIKVRTMGGLSALYWEDLGPVVKIDSAEVFTALQLGTVDVQADQSVMLNYYMFKEVTKYYTDLDAFPAFGTLFVNKNIWNKLPADLQKVVMDAAVEVTDSCSLASEKLEEEIYQNFEKEGTVITRLTPEQRGEWWKEARKSGGYFDKLKKELEKEEYDIIMKAAAVGQE